MTDPASALLEYLRQVGAGLDPDFLREAVRVMSALLMEIEVKHQIGTDRYERTEERTTYLKVSRQRKDFAVKAARALIQSSDLVAYEDLQITNLVKNHRLAKSISDASWGLFLSWVRYYGTIAEVPVVAVSPRFTTQDCSGCGYRVKKSLSTRTHVCPSCGLVLDRDENDALNILAAALVVAASLRTAGRATRLLETSITCWGMSSKAGNSLDN